MTLHPDKPGSPSLAALERQQERLRKVAAPPNTQAPPPPDTNPMPDYRGIVDRVADDYRCVPWPDLSQRLADAKALIDATEQLRRDARELATGILDTVGCLSPEEMRDVAARIIRATS